MDFKKRLIEKLKMTKLQAETIYDDYITVCEELAEEYHQDKVKNLGLFNVSRSFDDWIKEVAELDKEQEFLLEREEIFEWQKWYQKGMTPTEALNCNYHNYG